MDLLTVNMREIGHLLGHDHVAECLIAEMLTAGKHRPISYKLGRCLGGVRPSVSHDVGLVAEFPSPDLSQEDRLRR